MLTVKKQKIAHAFDKGAPNYDWAALVQREVAEKLMSFLPDTHAEPTPIKILEIGCGTGILTKMLLKKYPSAQITAIDISAKMIKNCRKKLPFVTYEQTDGETYETIEKFDLIISNMAIQWFDDPAMGINHFKDFLMKDGAVYYSTLGQNNFKEWRDVLKKLNFSPNNVPLINYDGIIAEEFKHTMYHDPFDFIRSLKAIGANHSNAKRLSPQQLKQACAALKSEHCCSVTWHILYGRLSR